MGDLVVPSTFRRRRVEGHCCIDVSVLRKTGKLEPGACGVWSWSIGTGIVGVVDLVAKTNSIEICGYVSTSTGVEPVQEVMQITRVPARFAARPCGRGRGATSTFLICPGCGADGESSTSSAPPDAGAGTATGWASPWKPRAPLSAPAQGCKGPSEAWRCAGRPCRVPQRYVPSVARRGGRGAGRRKYERLARQIAEADRAALSGLMAVADRLASSIQLSRP